jgi:hypothetical protein
MNLRVKSVTITAPVHYFNTIRYDSFCFQFSQEKFLIFLEVTIHSKMLSKVHVCEQCTSSLPKWWAF